MCDYRIMLFSLGIVIYLLILCDKLTNVNHHALMVIHVTVECAYRNICLYLIQQYCFKNADRILQLKTNTCLWYVHELFLKT